MVFRLEGAFPGTSTVTFRMNEQDDGVKVTQTFDYTIGGGVLGRVLTSYDPTALDPKVKHRCTGGVG